MFFNLYLKFDKFNILHILNTNWKDTNLVKKDYVDEAYHWDNIGINGLIRN